MTRHSLILAAILMLALAAGCAPKSNALYYYGDYYETYYASVKNPCEQTQAKHIETLDKIIDESAKENKTVPPGIYAEYGYYKLKAGQKADAVAYFQKEEELYPESKVLMDKLISMATVPDDGSQQSQATGDAQ